MLTVFLALGAWRIARSHVLTRRIPAIEALGAATVLCVDKTGTLTQNRMAVARLRGGRRPARRRYAARFPKAFHRLVELAILASQEIRSTRWSGRSSSCTSNDCSPRRERLHAAGTLLKAYPLSDSLLAMTHVWRVAGEAGLHRRRQGRARGHRRPLSPR